MSMMVNPVSLSNVRFTGNEGTNILERPGAFTKPEAATQADQVDIAPKKTKKKKALKFLTGLLVAAAALVTLKKTNVLKVLDDVAMKDAGIVKKAGHYLAKAGEAIAKYTVDPIVGLFGKLFKSKAA